MSRLHDSTRRQLCSIAFLGLCVLPTLAVGGWAISRRLPWNRQSEETRLSAELGVAVSMESMAHTLPGVIRYKGLKITDPETGRELLRCAELESTWTSMTDSQRRTRPAIALAARQVESAAGAWERLAQALRRRMECQSGRPEVEVRATADSWILHDGNEVHLLRDVEGGIGLMPEGIQAQLAFQLHGGQARSPVRMRVVRNREVSPPANSFDLDTAGNRVPCRLLATCCKELGTLGDACSFTGYVSMYQTPGGWSGAIAPGQLRGIDLGKLARDGFAPAISGTADVALQKLCFQRGRIDDMAGTLVAGPGALGRGVLNALAGNLRLTPVPPQSAESDSTNFDRIGVDFWIDSRGVCLAGHCDGAPGALITAVGQALLTQSERASQPQPLANLVQALAPAEAAPISATQQSCWLARLLPLPDAARK